MSRAFIKETDDLKTPAVAERPISAARNLVTATGARKIEGEVASIRDRLKRSDDAEQQAALARDMRYWEMRRSTMEIVEITQPPAQAGFGVTVSIERDGKAEEVSIVGEDEADPTVGAIAWTAPLARAIEGFAVGDHVRLELPTRADEVQIVALRQYTGQ